MQIVVRFRAFNAPDWFRSCEKQQVKRLKAPAFVLVVGFVFALALMQNASANLVTDGNFTGVTYSGTSPMTTLFGQFGSGYTGTTPTPTLTVSGWTTAGYNYVYAPNTADFGTTTGSNAGAPNQAAGQFNITKTVGRRVYTYGNTYLWGTNNVGGGTMAGGGSGTIDAAPGGGNFIAMDGVYEVDAVSQTITGLTVGKVYALTFSYAAAQQQSFTGATTEWVVVNFGGTFVPAVGGTAGSFTGGQTFSTGTISLPSQAFSGWYQDTVYLTATSTSETLSFLAGGTPAGEPPFSLVANVDMEMVPDFSNWLVFAGFGAACILFEIMRRRRLSKERPPAHAKLTGSFSGLSGTSLSAGTAKPAVST